MKIISRNTRANLERISLALFSKRSRISEGSELMPSSDNWSALLQMVREVCLWVKRSLWIALIKEQKLIFNKIRAKINKIISKCHLKWSYLKWTRNVRATYIVIIHELLIFIIIERNWTIIQQTLFNYRNPTYFCLQIIKYSAAQSRNIYLKWQWARMKRKSKIRNC